MFVCCICGTGATWWLPRGLKRNDFSHTTLVSLVVVYCLQSPTGSCIGNAWTWRVSEPNPRFFSRLTCITLSIRIKDGKPTVWLLIGSCSHYLGMPRPQPPRCCVVFASTPPKLLSRVSSCRQVGLIQIKAVEIGSHLQERHVCSG